MTRTWMLTVCSLFFCGCLAEEAGFDDDGGELEEWRDGDDVLDPLDLREDEEELDELDPERAAASMTELIEEHGDDQAELHSELEGLASADPRSAAPKDTEPPSDPPSSEPPDEPDDDFSWGGSSSLRPPTKVGTGDSSNIACSDCAP